MNQCKYVIVFITVYLGYRVIPVILRSRIEISINVVQCVYCRFELFLSWFCFYQAISPSRVRLALAYHASEFHGIVRHFDGPGLSFPIPFKYRFDDTFSYREQRFYGACSPYNRESSLSIMGRPTDPCITNTRLRFAYNTAPYFWTAWFC